MHFARALTYRDMVLYFHVPAPTMGSGMRAFNRSAGDAAIPVWVETLPASVQELFAT